MLKKVIEYEDLDGNTVTDEFYFNLSKAEIAEMELSHSGGFSKYLERLIKSEDGGEIITTFKNILLSAIGRKSEDGKRFIKSEEIKNEFLQSDAYSVLFMELITDGEAAAKFVQAIIPADLVELEALSSGAKEAPAYIRENREPTSEELKSMSKSELQVAFLHKNKLNQETSE